MKNLAKIVLVTVVLFCAFTFKISAQQVSDENTYFITRYFQQSNNASKLLEEKSTSLNSENQLNLVKLTQVGNSNQIDIKSSMGDSQSVSQFGNNNNYNFINYYNNAASNFNIIQQGNANSLEIYGENALIKNISIVQKANFETLIINNY